MALDSKSGSRKINQNVDLAPGARDLTTTGNITAGAFYGDGSNLTGVTTASANDALITITAGGGLTGGGGFTVDQAADAIITVSHSDTSAQDSVANTVFNVIQSITLDTYGHITAIESKDIGTAGFYIKTTGETGVGQKIGLGSLTYQTVQFFAGTGLSVVRTDNEIQFSAPNAANWDTAYGWGNHANTYLPLVGGTVTGNLNVVTSNVGTTTEYGLASIEGVDAHLDLISSAAGSWGSAINFVEGTNSTTNANIWSIARQTTGGDGSLNFNYGTLNNHNVAGIKVKFSNTGIITAAGGNSTNWNTAYNYSQAGHLPLAGGTLTGDLTIKKADPILLIQDTDTSVTTANSRIRLAESGASYVLDNYWDIGAISDGTLFDFSILEKTDNRFHISSGGNIGIGLAEPSTKLDVDGVITATGGNSTNWNAAYGWGNHTGLYLPLGGGSLTGQLTVNSGSYNPLKLDRTAANNVNMSFYHQGVLKGYLGIGGTGDLSWGLNADSAQNNTIIHAGNIANQSVANASTIDGFDSTALYRQVYADYYTASPTSRWYVVTLPYAGTSGWSDYFYFDVLAHRDISNLQSQLHYRVYLHNRGISANNNQLNASVVTELEQPLEFAEFGYKSGVASSSQFFIKLGEDYSGISIVAYPGENTITASMIASQDTAPTGFTAVTPTKYAKDTINLDDVTSNGSTTNNSITALSFLTPGGNSGQFLKANGSLDSNSYALASHTHSATDITSGTLADARLSGVYSGITLQTNGGNTHYTTPNSGSPSTNDRTVFGLAQYKNDNSAAVGAIVFYAPNTNSTIMHRLRIEGMLYSTGPTVMCIVQGYRTTGSWTQTSKVNLGITDVQVRFAVDAAGKNCVILGDVGTTWSYPMMAITHAMFSHGGVTDAYCKDWTVGLVTSLTGFTQLTAFIENTAINNSIIGNAGTATKLLLPKNFTIGNTAKAFDGSEPVSWTLAEIGAAPSSHSHSYLPLSGGTVTGTITASGGIAMSNTNLTGVNHITIADPGPNEGIEWLGGNGWKIYESPDDLTTNAAGSLQFVNVSTRRMTIDINGNVFALGSSRAPIFYDNDNTAYYVDPNSVSVFNEVRFDNYLKGYGNIVIQTTDNYIRFNQSGQFSNGVWFGSSHIKQGDNKYITSGGNGGTTTSRVYIYGGTYTGTNIISIDGNTGIIQTTADSMRAPIFYDYNDTGYYLNPQGFSNLGSIKFNDVVSSGAPVGDAVVGRNYAYNTLELKGYGAEMMIGSQSTDLHINYRYCNNTGNNTYTPQTWYWRNGTSSGWSNHYWGLGEAASSLRAPIFYDSNNTGYYVDPASTSVLNTIQISTVSSAPYISLEGTRGMGLWGVSSIGMRTVTDTWSDPNYHGIRSTSTSAGWSDDISINSYHDITMRIDSNGNNADGAFRIYTDTTTSGNLRFFFDYAGTGEATGSFRAPIFYDSNDTGYYVDPASTSVLNGLSVLNTVSLGNAAGDSISFQGNVKSNGSFVVTQKNIRQIDGENYWNINEDTTVEELVEQFGTITSGDISRITKVDDNTAPAPGCFQITNDLYFDSAGDYIKVDQNSGYTWEMWVKYVSGTDTDSRIYLGWNMYNSAKSSFGNVQRYWGAEGIQVDANSSNAGWHKITGTIAGIGTATGNFISGTEYVRPLLLLNYGSSGNVIRVCGFKLYKSRKRATEIQLLRKDYVTIIQAATNDAVYTGKVNLINSGTDVLRIETPSGYTDIGAGNTTFSHFTTDRGSFYFDKSIQIASSIIDYSNTAYYLDPASTSNLNAVNVSSITIGGGATIQESTDRADLIQITSNTSGWGGLQIRNSSNEGRWSFMTDGEVAGIYNDEDNYWHIYFTELGATEIKHGDGATKLATSSGGVSVTGTMTASGDVVAYSDASIKENIQTIDNALEKVVSMRGVSYNRTDVNDKSTKVGVIAQEIQKVLPEVVQEQEDGLLGVSYGNITAVLIEAIKEQQKQIEELKAIVDGLTK